jgi:hypothetical protein
VKFTGSLRHLFGRADKKQIPPPPEQAHNRADNRRAQRLHETSRFCTVLVARLREPGGRPAGFPLWPFRNWGILLTPLMVLRFEGAGRRRPENACVWAAGVGPQKNQRFWGAPRPRNEKPGAVSRAKLGHTPEGYLFIHEFRFNVQKSQVACR